MPVRGVAGDEDPADAEPVGDHALHRPGADLVNRDRVIRGQAEGRGQPLQYLLLAHGVGVVVGVLQIMSVATIAAFLDAACRL